MYKIKENNESIEITIDLTNVEENDVFYDYEKLKIDNDRVTSVLIDIEGEEIDCSYEDDESVTIDTKNLSYIKLSIPNLVTLIQRLMEADEYFSDMDDDMN